MRDYGKIECKFWGWAKKKKLSDPAKLMAAYLLAGPHSNSVGCYCLPDGYIQGDLGWTAETVSQTLSELSKNRFAYRCETTEYILIRDHLNHNPPINGNIGKAMEKIINAIPHDFAYWPEFIEFLKPFENRFQKGFINGLAKDMPTQEQEQEQKQESTSSGETETSTVASEPSPPPPDDAVEGKAESSEPEDKPEANEPDGLDMPETLRRAPPLEATDFIRLFDDLIETHFGANKRRPWPNQGDYATAKTWLDNGADLALVENVVGAAMAGMAGRAKEPPGTLSYLTKSVSGAIKGAKEPLPDVAATRGAQGSGLHVDAEISKWAARLQGFRATGLWLASYGPAPGKPGCEVPTALLEKEKADEA